MTKADQEKFGREAVDAATAAERSKRMDEVADLVQKARKLMAEEDATAKEPQDPFGSHEASTISDIPFGKGTIGD